MNRKHITQGSSLRTLVCVKVARRIAIVAAACCPPVIAQEVLQDVLVGGLLPGQGQGGDAAGVGEVDVGAGLDEQLDAPEPAPEQALMRQDDRGRHDVLAAPLAFDIGLHALRERPPDRPQLLLPGQVHGDVQRRAPVPVGRVHVGAGAQQQPDGLGRVLGDARDGHLRQHRVEVRRRADRIVQRRLPDAVGGVHGGRRAALQQVPDQRRVPRRQMQGAGARPMDRPRHYLPAMTMRRLFRRHHGRSLTCSSFVKWATLSRAMTRSGDTGQCPCPRSASGRGRWACRPYGRAGWGRRRPRPAAG